MLKGVKNPANSGSLQQVKLKHIFWNVLFSFFICGYKNIQPVQTDPPKKYLETLSWFSQPDFQAKGKALPKLDRPCNVTGRVNIVLMFSLSFSLKVQADKIDSEFPKTFYGEYSFVFVEYFCNCIPQNESETFQKLYSTFSTAGYRNWLDVLLPLAQNIFRHLQFVHGL